LADIGPDCGAVGRLVRRIARSSGTVNLTVRVAPRFD
jgi:hypothetical protein